MSTDTFGKYRLLRRIAFGGMAEIFLARLEGEEGFQKTCVLKRILPQFSADQDFVQMFVDEAVLAARLSHPNVVQTYDFGSVDGIYFIAMEFIDGVDLRKLVRGSVKTGRSLSFAECSAMVEEMCRGLSYVHNLVDETGQALAIVHRDISPHNVMVARAGQTKIMDFGIAKAALRATQTSTGTVKGKLAYMAPEQAAAKPVDKRTDQFAVGLVLWECITGERHFSGSSEPELYGRVLSGELRDVRELRPSTPEPLADIVNRMLQPDPDERYADLSEAESALSAFRFSLGAQGAIRLRDLVLELAPPEVREQSTEPSSNPSVAENSAEPRPNTLPLPEPRAWAPATSSDERRPTQTMDADEPGAATHLLNEPSSSPSFRVEGGQLPTDASSPRTPGKSPLRRVFAAALLVVSVGLGSAAYLVGGEQEPIVPVSQPDPTAETFRVLSVDSTPNGAAVWIDGKDTGLQTPTSLRGFADGRVVGLQLRKSGFSAWQKQLVVGEDSDQIDARLESVAKPSPTPVAASVRVVSVPTGAAVSVDGRRLGRRTPTTLNSFKVGDAFSIELALRGYKSVTKAIVIEGEEMAVEEKLQRLPSRPPVAPPRATGTLSLRSAGPWVEVFLGRKKLGVTPMVNVKVPAGSIDLRLVNEAAGIDKTVSLEIPANRSMQHTLRLP